MSEDEEKVEGSELRIALEELMEEIEHIGEALDEGGVGNLVGRLLTLADKIGKVSPQLAPMLGVLAEGYGKALTPVFDEFANLIVKAGVYYYEKAAEVGEELASAVAKFEKVRAKEYATKVKILQKAGFTKKEAMSILLTEIARAVQNQNSWSKIATDIGKNIKLSKSD